MDLVDHGSGFNGSDGFSEVADVPDVEGLVSSSGGEILAVGGDGDGVHGSIVGFEGGSDLEVDVPDLESSVPADRGEVGLEGHLGLGFDHGGVSHAGHPFSVVVGFTGEFAVGEGVPELDGFVGSRGDDLSVVGGEATGEDFFGVADESFDGQPGSQVPESEGLVPR